MNSTRKRLFQCVALLAVVVVSENFAPAVADFRARQADAVLASFNAGRIPGLAVLVLQDGQVAYEQGYGVTDLHSLHPIGEHTNFRLASVTKQFTAMAIMLLVHDGKIKYDDHLTDIFPEFPGYGRTITIRNLLNHTSGLQDYEDLMPPQAASEKLQQISDKEVLDLLKHQTTTKFQPGTHWQYSNSGYVILGLVVQKVSGQPFRNFLHDRIFAPLHMDSTVLYEKGKNEVIHRAYGHTKTEAGWQQTDQSSTSATQGDGGVYSSLADLAKWDGALRKHTLLSKAELRPAVTPVNVPGVEEPDGKPAQYGFGWFLNPYKDQVRMWHYGETIGFRTAIERFTADNLTIIVLANRADVDANGLALKLADIYLPEK
ncbi:MAG TPA: serine hydrolase domain-containing protein [Terriglobales bacterium]|nr:serine hydrolase domain-containing protein [Terriglobales bacterium]